MSQKNEWRRFVETRRVELHDAYPCATSTQRRRCPKHRGPVGPVTGICKPCRDELYEQLAAEYTAAHGRQKGDTTMSNTDNSIIAPIVEREVEHGGEIVPDDVPIPPAPSEELARRDPVSLFELDQRRANLYAESGYWPDAKSQAQALVKIEAGRALGLPAIVAMSEVYVIQGKPTLGAGALAALVKTSGRYDYRIVEHTEQRCTIRFFDLHAGELCESVFTLDDARKAGLAGRSTWRQYPRNMLFARALSNGVAWFCPDTTLGRAYVPEELDLEIVDADVGESEAIDEPPDQEPDRGTISPERQPTGEQIAELQRLAKRLRELDPDTDWRSRFRELAGCPADYLTETVAGGLIEQLQVVEQEFAA